MKGSSIVLLHEFESNEKIDHFYFYFHCSEFFCKTHTHTPSKSVAKEMFPMSLHAVQYYINSMKEKYHLVITLMRPSIHKISLNICYSSINSNTKQHLLILEKKEKKKRLKFSL